jgi:hypothetical protein
MAFESVPVATVGLPPLDLLRMSLLQRRAAVFTAIAEYERRRLHTKQNPPSYAVQSAVYILFLELEPALKRWLDDAQYIQMRKRVMSDEFNLNILAFREMNIRLDNAKIIRLDLERAYDGTSAEDENAAKGL